MLYFWLRLLRLLLSRWKLLARKPLLSSCVACTRSSIRGRLPATLICNLLDPGGRPDHYLFDIYRLSGRFDTAESNAAVREGMLDLLSGRKTNVRYFDGFVSSHICTLPEREHYQIKEKNYEAIVFDDKYTSDSKKKNFFHVHYIRCLNPETGLWLKSEFQGLSGDINLYEKPYLDTDITIP